MNAGGEVSLVDTISYDRSNRAEAASCESRKPRKKSCMTLHFSFHLFVSAPENASHIAKYLRAAAKTDSSGFRYTSTAGMVDITRMDTNLGVIGKSPENSYSFLYEP